jgi:hypothetical protein
VTSDLSEFAPKSTFSVLRNGFSNQFFIFFAMSLFDRLLPNKMHLTKDKQLSLKLTIQKKKPEKSPPKCKSIKVFHVDVCLVDVSLPLASSS